MKAKQSTKSGKMGSVYRGQKPVMSFLMAAMMSVMTFVTPTAWACDMDGKSGILPPNNMRIGVANFTKSLTGLDEASFGAIIDRVTSVYAPIVAKKGGVLSVEKRWTDETVNAYADRKGNNWNVHMFGGLARHPAVTIDGFMLVVCHELGHHLGGAPRYAGMDWATNEGQADYFGTMKCMRRVLTETVDLKQQVVAGPIDPTVQQTCAAAHRDSQEQALCNRIGMAGKSLADLFASFGGTAPKFNTPDTSVVAKTFDGHPKSQCRLDTYLQGSLCAKPYLDDVDDRDPKRGVCVGSDGYKLGLRPLCWYKPGVGEN